jgi:hypothetical protein
MHGGGSEFLFCFSFFGGPLDLFLGAELVCSHLMLCPGASASTNELGCIFAKY